MSNCEQRPLRRISVAPKNTLPLESEGGAHFLRLLG